MRIGEFGRVNRLTVDAIRHYMDLGLLVPEKKGGQYDFDDNCQKDLSLIMEFKAMGFSLNEIKTILTFRNLGMLAGYEENAYYQSLFNHKYKKIDEEIAILTVAKEKLKTKIAENQEKEVPAKIPMGIPIETLNLLACHKCGGTLSLEQGSIQRNQLIDGELTCGCETYRVESGILISGQPMKFDSLMNEDGYISDYILNTDSFYLETLQKGIQLLKRKISGLDLEDKVILEPGSGIGFLLRTIYEILPNNSVYIAVDYDRKKLTFLKSVLERAGIHKHIIFICADFSEVPIKKGAIDIILDHAGTSNYSFDHVDFLLKELDPLTKENAYLIGTFLAFKNFSHKSKVLPEFRDNFIPEKIREKIEGLHYKLLEETTSDLISKGGIYEDYFVAGEEVYNYMFIGKR